ncbi:hypothetical protein JOC94_000784 [Bacillus thermophilus]|uniref:Uncharacterized protein n=1 Tax=Siminovitchia thermophila TaxID=1245522 RepID=A0ABS2R3T7_9BACI|nr:hypothetical protein [Siminovitchia thermophila]MBM7713814.1 hypothetical protein [Siminovitchia thermophila]ONK21375.1 hypothetical protein BLX87_22095 [Bacillus sp. VT-16-64]
MMKEQKRQKNDIVTPEQVPGVCGTKKRRDCCKYDEKCRLDANYNPRTGKLIYTGKCCGAL